MDKSSKGGEYRSHSPRPGDRVHAWERARESSRPGTEILLVVGGDGTIHEVANGVLEEGVRPPALAVMPVGTGNDFYRIVGAPRRLDFAIGLLKEGEVA